jgi:hypothetical protein
MVFKDTSKIYEYLTEIMVGNRLKMGLGEEPPKS